MSACLVDSCQGEARARGLCHMHLARFYRHGTTDVKRCWCGRRVNPANVGPYCSSEHEPTTCTCHEPLPETPDHWWTGTNECGRCRRPVLEAAR